MKFSKRRHRYLKKRIIVLRFCGYSNREIAERLGISERSVYRLSDPSKKDSRDYRDAVTFPKGSSHASVATKLLAVRVLGYGLGLETTGWLFGKSASTIARWRREVRKIQKSSSSA